MNNYKKTLYVIGNGFDLAHGLKTSYWNFRNYLRKYAEEFYVKLESHYGYEQLDLDDYYNCPNSKKAMKERDERLYKVFWKNIEESLGDANEDSMLNSSESIVNSLYLENGLIGIKDTMDAYWKKQYSFIEQLQDYVFKWAKQICLHKCVPLCTELFNNENDLFLTFNYTNVLEKIYKIPSTNILHIHGGLPPYCYEKPVLGHGNYDAIEVCKENIENAEHEFDEAASSIYGAIADFYRNTLKDTYKILSNNLSFFNKLGNIDNIKVIGHSFGQVDYPYFQQIISNNNNNAEWFVYYYNNNEKEYFQKVMLDLGINQDKVHILCSEEFWNKN